MNTDNLKNARKNSGMTQKDVSDTLKISPNTYKNYEQGLREPNGDMIVTLANLFNVTTDYLLGREAAPDPFGDLNLCEEDEAEVLKKYMSLPDSIRACMLDVLVQLGDAAKNRESENSKPKSDNIVTVSTTLGELEEQQQAETEAREKGVG